MFRLLAKSSGLLFSTHDHSIQAKALALHKEVEAFPENRLLNTAPDDLAAYLIKKYGIEAVTLDRENWYVDHHDKPVDVRGDWSRGLEGRSDPFLVPGQHIEIHVPVSGDAELFYARPSTISQNPPRAEVSGNELILRYQMAADAPQDIRPTIDHAIKEIEEHLQRQRGQIDAYNAALPRLAAGAVDGRRGRLLAHSNRVAALGIPVRRKADAPKTYAVPTVRKKSRADTAPGNHVTVRARADLGDGSIRSRAQDRAGHGAGHGEKPRCLPHPR